MKKLILTLLIAVILSPVSFASQSKTVETNAVSTSKQSIKSAEREVRETLKLQLKHTKTKNRDGLLALYSENYCNTDGFDKKIYADLIKKTWELYPDIVYKMNIRKVNIINNTAIVHVTENAKATATEKVDENSIQGHLNSASDCIYYLEKIGDKWFIYSDSILNEKTSLTYGEADNVNIELTTPQSVLAGKEYTASLNIKSKDPKMIIIASIGQENITYPQTNSEEVFRKLPKDGNLERLFRANKNNFNEYTVASIGITRADVAKNNEIKLVVTGLGYVITRTNVISAKDFSKVKQNGKKKTTPKLLE